jgi:hypothetical protein
MNKRQSDNRAGVVTHEGVTTNTLYRLWDSDMAQTCVCDAGYSGPDCSRRECPRGDDPLTHRFSDCPVDSTNTAGYTAATPCLDEIQTITLDATGNAGDWFHLLFRDWTGKIWRTDNFYVHAGAGAPTCDSVVDLPVYFSTGSADTSVNNAVKQALTGIPNDVIGDVTVSATYNAGTFVYTVTVTFTKNPGNVYELEAVNSADMQTNLPRCMASDGARDFTAVTVAQARAGNKETATCSNRGVCDYDSGLCKCFKGYYGGDCSFQNALSQ